MDDLIRDDGVFRSEARSADNYQPTPEPVKRRKGSNLDSQRCQKLYRRIKEWFDQEWRRQAANRYQQALDEDYYDAMQWTEEEAQELLERGQAPLVYNEIKPTVDWILGTQRRAPIDFRVLAREPEGQDDAEIKTSLLKYLSDTNRSPMARAEAFEDSVKAGVGWLETGLRGDPTEEMLFTRRENWRRILYDSSADEKDLSDARYIFRWKWLDTDVAKAYFPDRKEVIEKSARGEDELLSEVEQDGFYLGSRVTEPGHDYDSATGRYTPFDEAAFIHNSRSRVRVIECWYREPERVKVFRGPGVDGVRFDPKNPEHVDWARQGYSLYDNVRMQVRCAIFVDGGLLFKGDSPYDHNRFPFVPIWCYRRARDNAPYGVIRNLRDPQDDLNKRASKALWLLSVNRITMDEGAVDDVDALRDEAARPDAVIVKRRGHELVVDRDIQLAQSHVGMMERNIQHIRNVGGVTDENLGRESNATSGKAIIARQEQGSIVTTTIFDNLRFGLQQLGELELSMVEQFYDEPKVIRVVGERGAKYMRVNETDPETGEPLNSITARQASFVIDEQDYRSSLRIAMFESLFEIVGQISQMAPQVALSLLDLLVESADVPNRDEIVARIRQLNGQRDPDEDIPPEEAERLAQAQAAEQQRQARIAAAQQELELAKLQGEIAKLAEDAENVGAETIVKRVQAMYSALQASQVAGMAPDAAQGADEIMRSAGFEDVGEQRRQQAQQQAAAQEQAAREQAAQQQAGAMERSGEAVGDSANPEVMNTPTSASEGMRAGIRTPEADGVRREGETYE